MPMSPKTILSIGLDASNDASVLPWSGSLDFPSVKDGRVYLAECPKLPHGATTVKELWEIVCALLTSLQRSVQSPGQEQESTSGAFPTSGGMQARSDSEGCKLSSTWEPKQEDSSKCQSTQGYTANTVSLGKERGHGRGVVV